VFEIEVFAIALMVGAVGGMLGVGGGVLLVPLLTGVMHVPIRQAIGASLVSVIATSNAAGSVYVAHGLTHLKLSMVLEIATTVGAIVGSLIAASINPRWLEGLFALMLVATAFGMRSLRPDEPPTTTGLLDTRYRDPTSGRWVDYGVRHLPVGMAASVTAGMLSGLVGVGGGVVKVPIMAVVMHVPLRAAVATSNFMIGVTAATGAIVYYSRGLVAPHVAVPAALGVLIGASIEPRLGVKVRSARIKHVFLALILIFAAEMGWKAVRG
jgi:uncharacterized membrane protein YfcA